MNNLERKILLSLAESGSLLSGQKLADKFSVSRNAIWKAVRSLQEQGYPISGEKRGYRLEDNDLVFAEAFHLNATVRVLDCVDSTNDEAKRSFTGNPLLIVASAQTNGKGKGETPFPSPDHGLYFTYLTKKRFPLSSFTAYKEEILDFIAKTLSVTRSEQSLLIGEEKVGGVIVETTVELDECTTLLVGVGFYPALTDKVNKISEICQYLER
ncbi:MAG: HTH domain-containing protein [Clostridia bacterium]|nr:HTH domain-containing protein [Clostridia bacterium]